MSAKRIPSVLFGALLIAGLTGCEVTRVDCDETPEADICQDDPEDDSGIDWDSDTPEPDASLDGGSDGGRDGGSADGGDASSDGGSADGGSSDGGSSDGGSSDGSTSEPLTIDEFCVAQLETAVAWRDALEDLCGGSTAASDRSTFLQEVFAYAPDDAEGKCITARQAPVTAGNSTFDGTKAQGCVDAFLASFDAPPDPFPTDGIDLAMYEAKVAHGAPTLIQIPACRATFKGKLTRGKACTDHFECLDGLRCLDAPGGGRTCETALVGGTCTQSSQCADGYTCVGATGAGGGRTCVKSTELPLNGGNCSFSLECSEGLVCNASNKCGNPTAQVICKP